MNFHAFIVERFSTMDRKESKRFFSEISRKRFYKILPRPEIASVKELETLSSLLDVPIYILISTYHLGFDTITMDEIDAYFKDYKEQNTTKSWPLKTKTKSKENLIS